MTLRREVQRMLPCTTPSKTVQSEDGEDFASWSLVSMKKVRVLCPWRLHGLAPQPCSFTAAGILVISLVQHLSERVVRMLRKTNFRITPACAIWLTLAWLGKDTGNCHLTLPATVFSSPWGTIDHISEAFTEPRGRKSPLSILKVWEEMGRRVGMIWTMVNIQLRTPVLLLLSYNGASPK